VFSINNRLKGISSSTLESKTCLIKWRVVDALTSETNSCFETETLSKEPRWDPEVSKQNLKTCPKLIFIWKLLPASISSALERHVSVLFWVPMPTTLSMKTLSLWNRRLVTGFSLFLRIFQSGTRKKVISSIYIGADWISSKYPKFLLFSYPAITVNKVSSMNSYLHRPVARFWLV